MQAYSGGPERVRVLTGRERELLLTAARLFLGNARDDEALSGLSGLDWPSLSDMAAKEGMSGVLALQLERLARTYRLNLPLEPLSLALRGTFVANGALFAELLGLRAVLQEKGIRAILLKGGALATTAYGGQIGLRPLSDLDLLMQEADLPVVREALLERGFRTASPSGTLLAKGSVMFDLHRDLINASRIRRRASAFHFDGEALWKKAVPLDPGDRSLLVLSPAHQFLHLAVHAQKHSFSRLIWFLDLALVSRQLDWEELLLQAQTTGTLRPVAYAAMGMARLLRVQIPAGVWVTLPSLSRLEAKFMDAVVARRAKEPSGELLVAFSIPSWIGKLGYLLEFTFPRRKVLSEAFPTGSASWFYLRRVGQILALALTYLRHALRWENPVEVPKPDSASRPAVGI